MEQNPFAGLPKSPRQLKAEADARLAAANQDAQKLLNELNGEPPDSAKYKMPSPHAPGEEPKRDPVQSIAQTMSGEDSDEHGNWSQLGTDGNWQGKPLPMSTTVNIADKIRNGLNPHRRS